MTVEYTFTPDELLHHMRFIGETFKLGSNTTQTGRGRRLYASIVGDDIHAKSVIDMCKRCYTHGRKEDITLTGDEILSLRKLITYCVEVSSC